MAEIAGLNLDVVDQGNGPPLLFLGPEHFIDANDALIEQLSRQWRVLAPRYPGFDGNTPPSDFRTVDDLTYLMLDYVATLDCPKVHIVGASLGGWLALEMGIRDCSRVSAMSLIAPLGIKGGERTSRDYADLSALAKDDMLATLFHDAAHRPDFANFDAAAMRQVGLERQYLAYYAWNPYLHNPVLKRWLHRIEVPVQLLWGAHDRYNAMRNADALLAALPDARLVTIDGAGHYPQLEKSDRVVDEIRGFATAHHGVGT